jgi:predicted metal-dependent phosphoesterase TrpH
MLPKTERALKAQKNNMYDLHTHSDFSDGSLPPEKLIEEARAKRLTLLALCDHDSTAGLLRAGRAAAVLGVPFINGTEIEADFTAQLHILGLGVDPKGKKLKALMDLHAARRAERNERLLKKLADAGMDVYDHLPPVNGLPNKSVIAQALTAAGFCSSVGEAFDRFLSRGRPFDVRQEYPQMSVVLDAITDAGGLPVLAHPMKMDCDHRALISDMKERGLWGVEAYYSSASASQTRYFCSLAREFGLAVTCGSDFHGPHRPEAQLGCAWRDVPELIETEAFLKERFGTRTVNFTRGVRRTFSMDEFCAAADRAAAELPDDLYIGLNGGVVISPAAKQHAKSIPSRPLFVLGEYHHGGPEGSYITLYYGSFSRVRPGLSGSALTEEISRVLKHEFRHHLEIRAGEHDLEYEDDMTVAAYLGGGEA